MIYLQIPSASKLSAFLEKECKAALTYSEVGNTQEDGPVKGYDNDFAEAEIGLGEADFRKAKKALQNWQMFPAKWTKILPEKTLIQVGNNVAMLARFAGLWWRNSCKILYIIDEPNRYGFAYATLPGHIEAGEELFLVRMDAEGRVFYSIKAFSKPYHIFAKIGYPMVRRLQAKFRKDSMAEMADVVQEQ